MDLLTSIRDWKPRSLTIILFHFMFRHHHIISPRSVIPVNKLHSWPVVQKCNCSTNHDKCCEVRVGKSILHEHMWKTSTCPPHNEDCPSGDVWGGVAHCIHGWNREVPHAHGWEPTADQMLQFWLQWGGILHPSLTATGSPSPNFASSLLVTDL